jgi:hypothetical protein
MEPADTASDEVKVFFCHLLVTTQWSGQRCLEELATSDTPDDRKSKEATG